MATKTINQKITISGGDEIARTLRDLARLGEQAFAQLADAAKKIDLNLPVDKVKQQLVELGQSGQQAFGQLAQAAQSSISSINQVGAASTQASQEVAQLGTAAQKTAQDVAAIGPAAQSIGNIPQQAEAATSALSNIGTAVKVVGVTLGGLAATFSGLAIAATAMGRTASDAVISIGRAADAAGVSIRDFSRASTLLQQFGLTSDQSAAAIKRLGELSKTAFDGARAAMQQAGDTGGQTVTALQRALQGTEQTLDRIARTGGTAAAKFAQGAKVIVNEVALQNEQTRAKFAQQMASMADITINGKRIFDEATAAILKFAGAFNEVTGATRAPTQVLTELADRLQKIPDAAQRANVLNTIFGKELGTVLLPALNRGTAAFVNMIGTIDRLRLGTEKADRAVGQDFRAAWDLLQAVIKKNNEEIGLLIAKPLTPFIIKFAEAMRRSAETFKIYEAAVNAVMPVIGKFLDEIAKIGAVDATFPETLKKGVEEFGSAVGSIFTNVIKPAFTGMIRIATEAANILTEMFGTKVTPIMVALGIALTALLGPINAVGVALLAVFGGGAATAGFEKFKESLKSFGIDLDAIKLKIEEFVKDIKLLAAGGKDAEVKNQWLVDLKKALIEFGKEIPAAIIAFGTFAAWIIRIVGPARAAQIVMLQMSGAMGLITSAAQATFFALGGLWYSLNIGILLFKGFLLIPGPLQIALLALAAAVITVVTNLDKFIAAWAGVEALKAGNLDRAEKAFEKLDEKGKGLAEGTRNLRTEMEKDPDLTGWQKTWAFTIGFLKGEWAQFLVDLKKGLETDIQDLKGLGTLFSEITRPVRESFEILRAAFGILLLEMRNQWGEFIASLRAKPIGPLRSLLPAGDTPEEIEKRAQAIQRLKERVEQLMRVAPSDKVRQAFNTIEADIKRVDAAAAAADQTLSKGFREVRPGVFEKIVTQATETVQKVEATFREIRPGVFERISSDAKETATKVNDAFRQIRPGVFEKIATDAKTATTTVQQQATETKEKLKDAVTIDPTKPLSELQKLEEGLKRYAAELLAAKEKADALARTPAPAAQAAPLLSDEMRDDLERQREAIDNEADDIEDALTEPYENALREINDILDSMKTEVTDALEDIQDAPAGQFEDRRGEWGPFQGIVEAASKSATFCKELFETELGKISLEDMRTKFGFELFALLNSLRSWGGTAVTQFSRIAGEMVGEFNGVIFRSISALLEGLTEQFDAFGQAMIAPFNMALQGITPIVDAIKAKIAEIGGGLGAVAPEGQPAGGGIGAGLVAAFQQALAQIEGMIATTIQNIVTQFQTLGPQIAAALAQVALADPFQPLVQQAQNAVNFIIQIFAQLGQALVAPFEAMRSGVDAIMQGVGQLVTSTFESLNSTIGSAASAVDSAIQQIISALQAAVAEAQRLAQAAADAAAKASSAGGGSGFARGGYTGDVGVRRVAGVVHGGEYVEPAHVVRQPGVRAFLETLRRVGNLREALRRFSKGFSVGGFVDDLAGRMSGALVPGYASGGLVTQPAGKPRNLGVLRLEAGGERFEVMADDTTAFKLQRFARRQLMTSGGRAPVWER